MKVLPILNEQGNILPTTTLCFLGQGFENTLFKKKLLEELQHKVTWIGKKYWISQSPETPNQITVWDDYDRYITLYGRMINATVRDLRASLDYWTKDREYCL